MPNMYLIKLLYNCIIVMTVPQIVLLMFNQNDSLYENFMGQSRVWHK